MQKRILFFTLVFCAMIVTACSGKNEKSKETEDNSKELKYSIIESAYDMSYGEIPKVYINTGTVPGTQDYTGAEIQIKDTTGQYEEIYDANAALRVRGHTTSMGQKKPYNIKFQDKKNILGMGESKKWCLLANLFDPTMMRNQLALDFARNAGFEYISKCQNVEVYFNGELRGMYLLCMPVSEGKDKVDIDVNNGDYLLQLQPNFDYSDKDKITTSSGFLFAIEEGNTENLNDLKQLLNNFETAMMYGYEAVEQYADMASFVDYYVLSELLKDVDFATSSAYYYVKDGKLYAGPIWDYDLSMGNVSDSMYAEYNNAATSGNSCENFYCKKYWFFILMNDGTFKEKVRERFMELQPLIENLTTDNELGKNRIDVLTEEYGKYYDSNYLIWNVGKKYGMNQAEPKADFKQNVEELRRWLIERNAWLLKQWEEETVEK